MGGVRNVEEFAAWQLADAFKCEVFALLKSSRETLREAGGWIQDGIECGCFQEEPCRRAFWFGERCFTATRSPEAQPGPLRGPARA